MVQSVESGRALDGKGKPNNFRFHDIRHTAATRTYDATDDLYLVKTFSVIRL